MHDQDLSLEGDRPAAAAPRRDRHPGRALRRAGGARHHRGSEHRAPRHPGRRGTAGPPAAAGIGRPGRAPGGRSVRAASQPGRGRPHRPQAQSRGAGREEARGGALRAAGHALRHGPQDAGTAGVRRRLRAPGAQGRSRLGAAVRRADPAAHAHRHHQAAGPQSRPARYRAGGTGPARAHRLDPSGARAGVHDARRARHRGLRPHPRRPAVEDRSPPARPRRDAAGHRVGAADAEADRGLQAAGRGAPAKRDRRRQAAGQRCDRSRRGAEARLRVRPVAAQAALVLVPGYRERVLREGQRRPVSAGAVLGGAGATLHAAGPAAARGCGPQAPAEVGRHGALSEGAELAQLPDAGRPGGFHDRGRAAQGRLRRDGAGRHLRAGAVRQADDHLGQTRCAGLGHRRARHRRGSGPSDGQRPRLGLGPAPGRAAAFVRYPGPAVPHRARHRRRQPHLRPPRRALAGPLVDRQQGGGLGARQRGRQGRAISSRSCGGWSRDSSSWR